MIPQKIYLQMKDQKGFSFIELVIVMAIFIIIMMIGSNAFEKIMSKSGQYGKSAESNIEGIVGLELLRSDIEHAGYGLPWSFQNPSATGVSYQEIADGVTTAQGIAPKDYNDTFPNAPRAIINGFSTKEVNGSGGLNGGRGPNYLVIKSTAAAINNTAKRWSYVNYTSIAGANRSYIKQWGRSDDIANKDRVITISSTFSTTGEEDKILMMSSTNAFYYKVSGPEPVDDAFKPGDATQMFIVYGINNPGDTSTPLTMPYNRADFYIKRPSASDIPKACNPGTGVLYKAVANNNGGGAVQQYPLLDCVGDMQVMFELDTGFADTIPGAVAGSQATAADIRTRLKNVRVYILTHEGKIDKSFTYPNSEIRVGDAGIGRTWTSDQMQSAFGADWRNYRWKVYTIVARPRNLN